MARAEDSLQLQAGLPELARSLGDVPCSLELRRENRNDRPAKQLCSRAAAGWLAAGGPVAVGRRSSVDSEGVCGGVRAS